VNGIRLWGWAGVWIGAISVVIAYFWQEPGALALGLFFMLTGTKIVADNSGKA